jgi:hypothetical protein
MGGVQRAADRDCREGFGRLWMESLARVRKEDGLTIIVGGDLFLPLTTMEVPWVNFFM